MALSPNINIMIKAAEKAGRSLVRDFGEVEQLQVSRKGPGDFVSAADHRAEEIIFNELSRARPDFGFIMEERGKAGNPKADSFFIVDPLDGTGNFLHGIPHWCVSIGLEEKGEVTAGIIYDPVRDETFRAEKGKGAFMKNKRLRVSGRTTMDSAMFATGQPSREKGRQELFMREYEAVLTHSLGIRRFGAAALDLAYVAAGRFEGFWERGLKAWDMAAGYIIVKESGGIVTDIEGRKSPIHESNVLAANTDLYDDLKKILNAAKQEKDAA
ncbi:MAG: inositol monophosphatase [Alphaproteobacteria bacterium CG_4_9_14_3_um_filter_47_13]|nr:MAG: inositol monophosphatase [Alphaproteobacteria bacterium CG_4_9_14_3_um_filter_47_13]